MLEEIGRVVKIEGSQALVEMNRHSACAHCGVCALGRHDKMEILVSNNLGAKINEQVKVTVSGPVILKSAFVVYIIPLFGLILGYLLGWSLSGEKLGVIFGIGSVLLVLYGLHYYDRKLKKENKLMVQITEVLSPLDLPK